MYICTQTSLLKIIKAEKYRIGYRYRPISACIYRTIGTSVKTHIGATLLPTVLGEVLGEVLKLFPSRNN